MTRPTQKTDETVLSSLRELYARCGYTHYKMNKFEEYDLYAHHKDFLISDTVLTFTDGTGKLLALKPDVTLSIVKNTRDDDHSLQKLYYNENVYRMAKGSRSFKEILQMGLECIGRLDDYCFFEVLSLALDSLDSISASNVLCVSHLDILSQVMDYIGLDQQDRPRVLHCVGEKNLHELTALLKASHIPEDHIDLIRRLSGTQGTVNELLPTLEDLLSGIVNPATLKDFVRVLSALRSRTNLQIDFSVVDDIHYYNGFVFKGFVEGIPTSVLSGGQYNMLMRKMGRRSDAIGFAVYLDQVNRYGCKPEEYDVDVMLLYDEADALEDIRQAVRELNEQGESVRTGTKPDASVKYRKLLRIRQGRTETLENHA